MIETRQVAKYVLSRSDHSLSGKKLQKLVYYCEAWHSTALDRPLTTEVPQAWDHGPVFRSLWDRLGYSFGLTFRSNLTDVPMPKLPEDSRAVLDAVLDFYGDWSERKLIDTSHDERPWKKAREKFGRNAPITHESMRKFYSGMIARNEARPNLPVSLYSYVLAEDMERIKSSLDDIAPSPGLVSMLVKAKTG